MTKKFLCVQGSPEIPKDSIAEKSDSMYRVYIEGNYYNDFHGHKVQYTQSGRNFELHTWQIEGNDCWEEVTEPAGRWVPDIDEEYYYLNNYNDIATQYFADDHLDKRLLEIGNLYRTKEEAEDEVKRRESIAKAWWPEVGKPCWMWRSYSGVLKINEYIEAFTADCYIGACHKTKEACTAWGKEYGHLFDKRPKHD